MNEDKEKEVEIREEWLISYSSYKTVDEMADFWLNKIKESNKALLTKLRGEIAEGKIKVGYTGENNAIYKITWEHGKDYFNKSKDQDIALIDKYLE